MNQKFRKVQQFQSEEPEIPINLTILSLLDEKGELKK